MIDSISKGKTSPSVSLFLFAIQGLWLHRNKMAFQAEDPKLSIHNECSMKAQEFYYLSLAHFIPHFFLLI
jgi:hypothetical protein